MKSKWFLDAVKMVSAMIKSFEYKCGSRQKLEYFGRESGKIGFTNLIAITLNFLTKSMQTELDKFVTIQSRLTSGGKEGLANKS